MLVLSFCRQHKLREEVYSRSPSESATNCEKGSGQLSCMCLDCSSAAHPASEEILHFLYLRASISSARTQIEQPHWHQVCSILLVSASVLTAKLQIPALFTEQLRSSQTLHAQLRINHNHRTDTCAHTCKFCASQSSPSDFDKDLTVNKYQNPASILFHRLIKGIFFCSETAL